ncbi:MocE family 2Fe-2S type ferredoxin [Mesorhizobium sp.]|uniref:MocE family 2Fe-2S type ferredoxin n=1 Tax=Mesorhizobium sp. TaxID=1871066 RepID=UPI000FE9BD4D|nr:MocE family 2Fe-2S type ferredoxin [Mesorhizobium sp.]RWI89843.1 MAG: Rieske family ferredoxin [Mesorhizobium sp.]
MPDNSRWIKALNLTDIVPNDVKRWDYGSRSFAIFRTAEDRCYATDDICTHEYAHISDGFVMNHTIECPRHASSFDIRTGEALNPPACINLKTYATKIEDGVIYVDVG